MKNICVAVWMVTYNHEAYIEHAVESVMQQQTSFNYKLFIGEDCSTDNTKEICKALKSKYPDNIELVVNETNLGPSENAYTIYDLCFKSGATYIALLEGDDYWTDRLKLQKQVDTLEANEELTFSMTRFLALKSNHNLKDENERFFKNDSDIIYDFDMFTKGWYGGTLTLLFKTSKIDFEIFKKYKSFRDIHLYTELLKNGHGICQNFVSAVYRVHNQGQHNSLTLLQQAQTAVDFYEELHTKNPKIVALKTKYRYFAQDYIEHLIKNRRSMKVLLKTVTFGFKLKEPAFVVKMLKKTLKSNRLFSKIKSLFRKKKSINEFEGSENYWEKRYQSNKNSGAGSYGRLATFKAEVLNRFVEEHKINKIIEYGSGDGNQLSLSKYPNYIGFDVSNKALDICREKFKNDATKKFYNSFNEDYKHLEADLTLSLDVIYHLIEDDVFENYMNRLFNSAQRFVIIYSSNYNKRTAAHVRSRKFTDWIDAHRSKDWKLKEVIKNKYPFQENDPNNTSMADFYIYETSMFKILSP